MRRQQEKFYPVRSRLNRIRINHHTNQVAAAAALAPAAAGEAALTPTEARAVLVARVISLVQGRAGVRREVVAALAEALNQGACVCLFVGGCVVKGGYWILILFI
jgi:histidine ammonia-lyase